MPIGVGAKPSLSISGTTNVSIVNWDSAASIPAGTAGIGKVIVTAVTGTQTVSVVVSTAIAMSGTGNVTIAGQPIGISGTVTGIGLSGSVSVINTVAISGTVTGGTVQQYSQDTTTVAVTGTGVLFIGIQSGATTARAVVLTTTGAQHVHIAGTAAALTITGTVATIIGTATQNVNVVVSTAVAMSGTGNVTIGGGTTVSSIIIATAAPFYQQNATAIAATGTGIMMMGIQSGATTGRIMMITTTGDQRAFIVNTGGPFTISGSASVINTVAISGTVTALGLSGTVSNIIIGTGAPWYQQNATSIAATGTGVMVMGLQSGATTGRIMMITTTGAQHAHIVNTADVFNIEAAGSIRYAGTSTNVNHLYLSITTSAAAIVVTSAANKVHIVTALWLNGNTTAAFKLQSATTDIGTLFIATSGVGAVLGHNPHGWNRTTASQSLVASAAASGSYSGWISYITISG